MKRILAVGLAALCAVCLAIETDDMSRGCLDCLCEAVGVCHSRAPCHTHCGPYHMNEAYWKGGLSPESSFGFLKGFKRCAEEKACAERAVVQYMKTWGTDCDNDGRVTCFDYARIHYTGVGNCHNLTKITPGYWKRFCACMGKTVEIDAKKMCHVTAGQ